MYIRKTYDEYQIQTNYGYGWEVEFVEDNRKEANNRLQEYRENIKGDVRLVVKRINKCES